FSLISFCLLAISSSAFDLFLLKLATASSTLSCGKSCSHVGQVQFPVSKSFELSSWYLSCKTLYSSRKPFICSCLDSINCSFNFFCSICDLILFRKMDKLASSSLFLVCNLYNPCFCSCS